MAKTFSAPPLFAGVKPHVPPLQFCSPPLPVISDQSLSLTTVRREHCFAISKRLATSPLVTSAGPLHRINFWRQHREDATLIILVNLVFLKIHLNTKAHIPLEIGYPMQMKSTQKIWNVQVQRERFAFGTQHKLYFTTKHLHKQYMVSSRHYRWIYCPLVPEGIIQFSVMPTGMKFSFFHELLPQFFIFFKMIRKMSWIQIFMLK